MNKVYKVIWSKAKNCYIVVSELTKVQGKSSAVKHIQISMMMMALIVSFMGGVHNAYAYNAISAGNQAINNLLGGKISVDSNEAINGSQLYAVQQRVIKNEKDIADIRTGNFIDQTVINNITNKLTDDGKIAKDDAHLVKGSTVYAEVRPTEGTYVKTANTTAGNLNALDAQTKTNTDAIDGIKTGNFFDQKTITNITNKLTDGGEIAKDNAHLVTGGTIYTEVRPTNGTYVKEANTTAGNLRALDAQTKTNTDAITKNTDAIVKNANNIASIKTGDFFDQKTITNVTNKLIDGGKIAKDNAHLVTGGTIYTEVRPTNGTYVKEANTTAGNLSVLDTQTKSNTDAIAKNTDDIAKNANNIASIKNGDFFDNTTITNITNKLTDGGEIVKDNAHLVTGGTIYTEVRPADGTYVKTVNTTAGNLRALDTQTKSNTDAIAKNTDAIAKNANNIASIKTGDFFDQKTITNVTNKLTDGGKIAKDNAHLVTGGTIYTEVRPTNGTYVKEANTTAGNLRALDAQTKTNTDAITKNTDAIVKNANNIASIKTGDFFDQKTITNVTNKLIDGGKIAKDNAHLVTGGTIYTEVRPTDGSYVKTANTTAGNLSALDTQIKTNTDNIAKNTDSIANIKTGNIFDQTAITNITNKLTDGGAIAKDNAHLVTGGTIYTEVRPADGNYVRTTNTTASNLMALDTQIGKLDQDGNYIKATGKDGSVVSISENLISLDQQAKTNTDAIAGIKTGTFFDQTTITNLTKKLTDGGAITKDNAHLVTGGTIYTEVRPTNGAYVKTANTTAANLNALDTQTKSNTDAIANIQTGNFLNQTTVEKFTEKLDVGQIEAGNTGLVSGGKVYEKIGSLDANKTYSYIKATSNISENLEHLDTAIASGSMLDNQTTVNNYIHKLSDGGKVEAGNTKLVTGGTVYEAMQNASFLDNEKVINNFTSKLVTGAKVEAGNTKLVNGGMVHQAVQEEAAAREKADMALAKGINDIGRQIGSVDKRINKVGAGAAALAALHTQEFDPNDKWDFAVGYGHYKNANAGALGAFYKPNANMIVSVASTFGNGDPMVNAGVSLKIGASGEKEKVVVKRADYDVLQQKISRQEQQLASQEEQIKELRNVIEAMAAKK